MLISQNIKNIAPCCFQFSLYANVVIVSRIAGLAMTTVILTAELQFCDRKWNNLSVYYIQVFVCDNVVIYVHTQHSSVATHSFTTGGTMEKLGKLEYQ